MHSIIVLLSELRNSNFMFENKINDAHFLETTFPELTISQLKINHTLHFVI
jgi:hypothetical protein